MILFDKGEAFVDPSVVSDGPGTDLEKKVQEKAVKY